MSQQSDNTLRLDDPRLTAYALDELDVAERAAVEEFLHGSAEGREFVKAIRETAQLLCAELAGADSIADCELRNADLKTVATTEGASRRRARLFVVIGAAGSLSAAALIAAYLPWMNAPSEFTQVRGDGPTRIFEQQSGPESRPLGAVVFVDSANGSSPVTGTPIGPPGPPHLPTGAPASLSSGRVRSGYDSNGNGVVEGFSGVQLKSHTVTNGNVSQPTDYLSSEVSSPEPQHTLNFVEGRDGSGRVPAAPSQVAPQGETTARGRGEQVRVDLEQLRQLNEQLVRENQSQNPRPVRLIAGQPVTQAAPNLGYSPVAPGQSVARVPTDGVAKNDYSDHYFIAPDSGGTQLWSAPQEGRLNEQEISAGHRFMLLDDTNQSVASPKRESGPFKFYITPFDEGPTQSLEDYEPIVENQFLSPANAPLSTFGIDVDTASYSNMRRFLTQNRLPPPNAVRIEELVNYFDYEDPQPAGEDPFSVSLEVGPCPWHGEHWLVRVGLKGKEIPREQRPPTNLVFLLDVSGSMRDANKLPLVQQAMELLVRELTEDDRVAIVTYAGEAGLVLDSTSGSKQDVILAAIQKLSAGGSTNGAGGLKLAYEKAVSGFIKNGSNRVILCTDGDFNVGISDDDQLVQLIQEQAKSNVFLSIFGFGMGNLKDAKLEKLADKGNGHYGYIDNSREARKVFVEELSGTLYTIAKDLKIQVEFNPAQVGSYRLIGYENRVMPSEDFHNDAKDGGDVGAGHSVSVLYEIAPVGVTPDGAPRLKYQQATAGKQEAVAEPASDDLLTLSLRYKQPDGEKSELREFPLKDQADASGKPSRNFEWAASVAAFGMVLRNSQFKSQATLDLVLQLAERAKGDEATGDRQEFIDLVRTAKTLGK